VIFVARLTPRHRLQDTRAVPALGNQFIEIALGLALIFLVLSLVCSLVQELISTGLQWRAKFLERGLRQMLPPAATGAPTGNDVLDKVLDSPFVTEKLKSGRILGRHLRVPAYLPSSTFSRAVTGLLDDSLTVPEDIPQPAREKLEILAREAQGNVDRFRKGVEEWFDATMTRVSAWYKRRARIVLFFVGLVVAGITNANLINVTDRLWRDDAVRAAVVAQAQRVAQAEDLDTLKTNTKAAFENTGDVLASVKQFDLPLWWNDANGHPGDLALHPRPGQDSALGWALGILLTAAGLSFGASFWFNVLSRLAQLRGDQSAPARQ
jgi:hypothetical protein